MKHTPHMRNTREITQSDEEPLQTPTAHVMLSDERLDTFTLRVRIRPGCLLSSLLFNNSVQQSPYPRGILSKTPSGCMKPWRVPNPVHTMLFLIPTCILQLLFGISKLPASLFLHFGAIIK